ncbi:MAG: ATP-binding protein [bacterium]|nr:ATP-binding protein [bacterium]
MKIRSKLSIGFFSSIFLITLVSFLTNFYIGRINEIIHQTSVEKIAVGDIKLHSKAIINQMFRYVTVEPGKIPSLEAEFQFSMDRLRHARQVLKERKDIQNYLNKIEDYHQEFMADAEILMASHKLRNERGDDLNKTILNLKESRHKIIDGTGNGSEKLRFDIAEMSYKDKEFIFQYQDKTHAEEWQASINTVISDLKKEGFNSLLVSMGVYSDSSQKAVETINGINELRIKENYYFEKLGVIDIESNINITLISGIIEKEMADVLDQGNFAGNIAYSVIFFSLFLGGFIVFIINRDLIRSLKELIRVARGISSDHFGERVKVRSTDELGYLGSVFNQMLDYIEKSRQNLSAANQQLRASEQQLRASNQQLRASEQQLNAFNQQLRANNQVTEQAKAELEVKVKELDKARLVLYSLTEDIQKEKESVEVKVEERTRELSKESGKLSSLIEGVKLGVVMVDLSLNVILVNVAAKSIFGKSGQESLTFKELEEKLKGVNISQALSYYVQEGKPVNIKEVKLGERYFRLFMSSVRDIIEKQFIGAVMIIEDITEQKFIDRMRTEIVSITSHQLRTPLSVIKGNLEMVLDGDFGKISAKQKEVLNEVFLGNERMVRLVNSLMDVAKIDEGKFNLDLKPVKLEELVAQTINELQPFAQKNGVNLSYQPPVAVLPEINLDAQKIKQAVQNIVGNGIKYSHLDHRGRVEVKVQKNESGKFLKVVIKDNGVGIPKEEQEKIFHRFFRGSNTTKMDPGGGSGIGLFIDKAAIERHGGKLWFESGGEGMGTTFYFTLPY